MTNMNGTGSVVDFNVKPKRISRTTYGITGKVKLNDDDLKNYEGELKVYVSSKGNGEYILSPVKIPRGPFCAKFINEYYRKMVMKEVGASSDMPNSDDKDLCPLFEKKTYTVKDYKFASDKLPSFLQSGWYKAQILIYDKNGLLVSGLETTAHLY